jgi:hypothetical protein
MARNPRRKPRRRLPVPPGYTPFSKVTEGLCGPEGWPMSRQRWETLRGAKRLLGVFFDGWRWWAHPKLFQVLPGVTENGRPKVIH